MGRLNVPLEVSREMQLQRKVEEFELAFRQKSDQYEAEKKTAQLLRESRQSMVQTADRAREIVIDTRRRLGRLCDEAKDYKDKVVFQAMAETLVPAMNELAQIRIPLGQN